MSKIKIVITILNIPRLLPHIILYLVFKSRLYEDIERNTTGNGKFGNLLKFLMLLIFHRQFRNLFYYRIGTWKYCCQFLLPFYETFTIAAHIPIGKGMIPAHCFSTIVNAERIGNNFTIFQNCTVGVSNGKRPIIGDNVMSAGRMYEPSSTSLSSSLKKIGFEPIRLKTDTPARLHIDSLNFDGLEVYKSDDVIIPFSTETTEITLPQIECYGTYTNEATHEIIRKAAEESMFYNGARESNGPRYCPSMEDKVLKFPEKTGHKLVIEPEGLNTKEVHVNGFSCSIPVEAQIAAYRTVKGMENAKFIRPAYAIQYDAFQPTNLSHSYESKIVKGLYFAGQVNGTSGYEEAAVQGFMAGVNAVLSLDNKEPFVLGRNESYIGVLTDDLVLKGVTEPYRMFTSRSEFRLLTREDNAEERLIEYGYKFGLISKTRYDRFKKEQEEIEQEIERLKNTLIKKTDEIESRLKEYGVEISQSFKAEELLKRPQLNYNDILTFIGGGLTGRQARQVEIKVKYSGYISSMKQEDDLESIVIPDGFSYDNISGLRHEYSEKLKNVKPATLGQALRIPGLTKTAISVLAVEIYKYNKGK